MVLHGLMARESLVEGGGLRMGPTDVEAHIHKASKHSGYVPFSLSWRRCRIGVCLGNRCLN